MSLISRTINQLFGGVSQQPPQLRSDGQCELMDNCWPDPAVGLTKRPNTVHVKRINTTTSTDRAVHFINRDAAERYVLLAEAGALKVYDLDDGTEKTVTYADGTSYLAAASPKENFKFLTVADTTFIVNNTVDTDMIGGIDEDTSAKEATIEILSTPTDHASCTNGLMRVVVNGVSYDSAIGKTIAGFTTDLAGKIAAGLPTYTVTNDGVSKIVITAPIGAPLEVAAYALDEAYWWGCNPVANGGRFRVSGVTSLNGNVGFVYIVAAVARQSYTINLDGSNYTYTVAADGSNALTTSIADGLRTAIPSATYSVVRIGSCLKISRNDLGKFSMSATDSYGDNGLIWFTDTVKNEAQLPPNFWEDITLAIKGDTSAAANPIYVTYKGGVWKETVKPGITTRIDSATMPHKLVRQSDGTFVFSRIEWADRKVGDDDSNPLPSFMGKPINNLFFYRERLGLLAGEAICMSRTADYYNLWANSVAAVTDDDVIDVTVSDPKVAELYHALPFQDALLVFSDTAQFQLTGGDVLSPKTVRLDATTKFNASKLTPPVAAGRDVFFAVDRGQWTSMREYFVLPEQTTSDAIDVTAHVPSFIPSGVTGMSASSLVDALACHTVSQPNVIYIHKFLWNGDQKVQSAWGTMTLGTDCTLLGLEFIDTVLHLVIRRSDGTYLEYMDFQANKVDTGMDFRVYLDRKVYLTGVYNSTTKKTTWTLPNADSVNVYNVVMGGDWGTKAGTLIQTQKTSSTTLEATGDFSAFECAVGVPFTMRYRFSELYLKDADKSAVTNGRLMLRNMKVDFSDTAYFRGEVTPHLRDKASYTFNGSYLGTATAVIGKVFLATDDFKFPIITENRGATIDLVNDSHLPSTFQSVTWEASFAQRAKRV